MEKEVEITLNKDKLTDIIHEFMTPCEKEKWLSELVDNIIKALPELIKGE